jgi:tRNA A37 methylthiotransferase MiaB
MAKITLQQLRTLREAKKKEMTQRESGGKSAQIIIGMGTCGIAAGAKEAFDAFLDELNSHDVQDTRITQTGCMGLCARHLRQRRRQGGPPHRERTHHRQKPRERPHFRQTRSRYH